ncbi:MAG TPA: outer membrane beta-barrel protein [Gammaproteobacteria bacterium]|nr:outer membrane beta-barrel protein [Gammaproteobacteria bacterium]
MRFRSTAVHLAACAALGLAAAPGAHAEGLLGKRYASALIGQVITGDSDLRDYDQTYLALEGRVNVPVTEHVDAGLRYGRETLDGSHNGVDLKETEQTFLGEATYHMPGHSERVDPFLRARAGLVRTRTEEDSASDTSNDLALGVAVGADIEVGERAAVAPELAYRVVDDNGELLAGAEANYWLSERAFLLAKAEYRSDQGDVGYFAGGGFHF